AWVTVASDLIGQLNFDAPVLLFLYNRKILTAVVIAFVLLTDNDLREVHEHTSLPIPSPLFRVHRSCIQSTALKPIPPIDIFSPFLFKCVVRSALRSECRVHPCPAEACPVYLHDSKRASSSPPPAS